MSISISNTTTITTDSTETTTITTTTSTNTYHLIVMLYFLSRQLRFGMTEFFRELIQEMEVASNLVTMIDL